jgi:hypothetical protein
VTAETFLKRLRHKDFAGIEQMLDQVKIDKPLLEDILRRCSLKFPNK